jgi:hypothetical protein
MAKLTTGKDGTIKTKIIDAEVDVIKCKFNYDGCVELDTDDYTYITLSKANLQDLIDSIDKVEALLYDKRH